MSDVDVDEGVCIYDAKNGMYRMHTVVRVL